MSLKMKLTSTIIAFILLASMLIVGVFAVKQTEFSVGGNIVFNASGIDATISAGTLSTTGSWRTGDGTGKMEEVEINTDKSASDLATKYATWSGLDLAFNEAGDDVTITFTITNNSTNADDSLVAYVNVDNGTNKNAVAYVKNAGAVIAPNTTEATDENVQTFVITFHILDNEVNASLEGFKIDFDIRYATVTAESSTDTTLTYEGVTYTISENNSLKITNYLGSSTEIAIPAYIKNGDSTYIVKEIGDDNSNPMSAAGLTNGGRSLIKISLPSTLSYVARQAFHMCSKIENIIIPEGVQGIGASAFSNCSSLKNIIIPNGVMSIGAGALGYTSLTNILIPSSVTSIGSGAFNGCDKLTTINFEGTTAEWENVIKPEGAIPEGITVICSDTVI